MRFHITAAIVAAATMLTGVVADDAQTSQATVTLTRTVQRVAATVTATRCSSTLMPTGSSGVYANGTIATPILSSTAAARQTGAAVALKIEMIGLAAAAGLAGLLI